LPTCGLNFAALADLFLPPCGLTFAALADLFLFAALADLGFYRFGGLVFFAALADLGSAALAELFFFSLWRTRVSRRAIAEQGAFWFRCSGLAPTFVEVFSRFFCRFGGLGLCRFGGLVFFSALTDLGFSQGGCRAGGLLVQVLRSCPRFR
jgi:hypothetical protein